MSATCIVILISIVIVIVLGTVLKVNYGILAIFASFVCGICIAGMSVSDVMNMWSVKLFLQMFSVTFFYAFAINNGTLELFARKLVYATRRATFLTPVILFVLCGVIAGIGPGTISTFLILTPIVMKVAKESEMRPAFAAIVLSTGVNFGGWSPLSTNGITIRGIIESSGFDAAAASTYGTRIFINMLVISVIFFAACYVIFRGWKCSVPNAAEAPAPFNKQQRTSLILIVIFLALVVVPQVGNGIGGGPVMAWLADKMDATFLAICFGALCVICRAGDEKKAIAGVPWKTIIMVCGMGMLISVASEAGVMDWLSTVVSQNFGAAVVPYIIAIVAALMSLFSSTMGVVIPTLYPLIYAICAISGASPVIMFSMVPIAATSSGNSPLSLQGGLVQAAMETDEERRKMFFTLIIIAVVFTLVSLLMLLVGIVRPY